MNRVEADKLKDMYLQHLASSTYAYAAGRLPCLSLPFAYPDGEGIELYFRRDNSRPGQTQVTDCGRTLSFLDTYGLLDLHAKDVVDVVNDLCARYETALDGDEIQVTVDDAQVPDAITCVLEATQAVAGIVALGQILRPAQTRKHGERVLTRIKTRLRNASLLNDIYRETPMRVQGKSDVHEVHLAYPDDSALILPQSLRSAPRDRAKQVAFESADIRSGYDSMGVNQPTLMCVYQFPLGERATADARNAISTLETWFDYVFDIETEADVWISRVTQDIARITGHRSPDVSLSVDSN